MDRLWGEGQDTVLLQERLKVRTKGVPFTPDANGFQDPSMTQLWLDKERVKAAVKRACIGLDTANKVGLAAL